MGNYGSDRGGFAGRGRSSGSRFGGRGGGFGRDRDFRRSERRPVEMHKVICDKCKKECEVPFKPTGDKPVYCSDCFTKNGSRTGSSGISSEQFEQINAKLDKILACLETLEIEEESGEDEEDSEEAEEK